MLEDLLKKYVKENGLFTQADKILVAVSGGIDSAILLHLLHNCFQNKLVVVHCNFNLRADESNGDEAFVRQICCDYNVPVYVKSFDTKKIVTETGESTQVVARELRYNWFEEMRQELAFNNVAIAHNADDVVETFFINLVRGTGIKGLTGIKNKLDRQHIIRPLMFASRKQIEDYAQKNLLEFRRDSSNDSIKYTRNRIRHNVIPEFKTINPSFNKTMSENIERLTEGFAMMEAFIDEFKKNKCQFENGAFYIPFGSWQLTPYNSTLLFELIQDNGFNNAQVKDILRAMENQPGAVFLSNTHRLLVDRSKLVVCERNNIEDKDEHIVGSINDFSKLPFNVEAEQLNNPKDINFKVSSCAAFFDMELVKFPLKFRKWKQGDAFVPFGMKGKKKLSDLFVDLKLSLFDKEKVWVMESEGKIAWVVGYRTDDRFKVTGSTTDILRLVYGG